MVFIIWSGWGLTVVPVVFVGFLATQLAVNGLAGDPTFYQAHSWPKVAACLVAGLASWLFGRYLNRGADYMVRNPETGRKQIVRVKGGHSLFFVPTQYTWVPLVLLGVVLALT